MLSLKCPQHSLLRQIYCFLSVSLTPPLLSFIACMGIVLLFNIQKTVWIGPVFLSIRQGPQIHGFQIFSHGCGFLFMNHSSCTERGGEKAVFPGAFFLNNNLNLSVPNSSLPLYLFFKASFCFVNFPESESCTCATWSLLHVLPPHLYTDAYVSMENIIDIQSIMAIISLFKKSHLLLFSIKSF